DVAVEPTGARDLVISVDDRQRPPANTVRLRPAAVRFQAGERHARVLHPNGIEQIALDRLLVGHVRRTRDHLARGVESDVLIRPARARRASGGELREAGTKETRVVPFLELVVVSVAIEAEAVRQKVA